MKCRNCHKTIRRGEFFERDYTLGARCRDCFPKDKKMDEKLYPIIPLDPECDSSAATIFDADCIPDDDTE